MSAPSSGTTRDAFIQLCEANPNGLTEDAAFGYGWSKDEFLKVANGLLKERRIELVRDTDKKLMCKLVTQSEKYKNLSEQDRQVLEKIKEAGDRGLQSKDIAHKIGITTPAVNRSVKTLEVKDIIKAVKSIQSKRGKVWMLMEITPCKEVAGGSWYKDGEFDNDKINQIRDEVLRMLRQRSDPQTAENISAANDRDEDDVHQILNVLELDGLVTSQRSQDRSTIAYKIKNDADVLFKCAEMPCFSCPVRSQCTPRPAGPNVPTPRHCEYFTKWLYGGKIWDQDLPPLLPPVADIEEHAFVNFV